MNNATDRWDEGATGARANYEHAPQDTRISSAGRLRLPSEARPPPRSTGHRHGRQRIPRCSDRRGAGRAAGQASGRGGGTPWLAYSRGETAATILETLPAWASAFSVSAVSASYVKAHMGRDPYQQESRLWSQLYAGLLERLCNPALVSQPLVITTLRLPSVEQLTGVLPASEPRETSVRGPT